MQTSHEGDFAVLENKTDSIITQSNAEILALGLKTLQVWNLMESSGGFDLFDHSLDAPLYTCIGDGR
jgi:hypothetical protein